MNSLNRPSRASVPSSMKLWMKIKSVVGATRTMPPSGIRSAHMSIVDVQNTPSGKVTKRATDYDTYNRDIAIASDDVYGAIQHLSLDEVLKMAHSEHWKKS